MKIGIGKVIKGYDKPGGVFALSIAGLGVLEAKDDIDDMPFQCVILSKSQKKKLFKMLEKEFKHE